MESTQPTFFDKSKDWIQNHQIEESGIRGVNFSFQGKVYNVAVHTEKSATTPSEVKSRKKVSTVFFRIMNETFLGVYRSDNSSPDCYRKLLEVSFFNIESFIDEGKKTGWSPLIFHGELSQASLQDVHFTRPLFPSTHRDRLFFSESFPELGNLLAEKNVSIYGNEGVQTTFEGRDYTVSTVLSTKGSSPQMTITVSTKDKEACTYTFPHLQVPLSDRQKTAPEAEHLFSVLNSISPPQKGPSFPWKWVALALIVGFGLYYRQSIARFFQEKTAG